MEKIQGNKQGEVSDEQQPQVEVKGGTIITLSRIPRYYTFKIGGVLQGHHVTTLTMERPTNSLTHHWWPGEAFLQRSFRGSM